MGCVLGRAGARKGARGGARGCGSASGPRLSPELAIHKRAARSWTSQGTTTTQPSGGILTSAARFESGLGAKVRGLWASGPGTTGQARQAHRAQPNARPDSSHRRALACDNACTPSATICDAQQPHDAGKTACTMVATRQRGRPNQAYQPRRALKVRLRPRRRPNQASAAHREGGACGKKGETRGCGPWSTAHPHQNIAPQPLARRLRRKRPALNAALKPPNTPWRVLAGIKFPFGRARSVLPAALVRPTQQSPRRPRSRRSVPRRPSRCLKRRRSLWRAGKRLASG